VLPGGRVARSGRHLIAPSGSDTTDSSSEPNWLAPVHLQPQEAAALLPGRQDAEFNATGEAGSILFCPRTLRDVLSAMGYEVHFQELAGGHDNLGWRGTLADGLRALMGDMVSKPPWEHAPAQ